MGGGKIGGKKTKQVIVTDKFNNPKKYNLTIGQKFESVTAISKYTNKSRVTISQWQNKGWLL